MGSIILRQLKLRMYAHMILLCTLEKSGHQEAYGQALLKLSQLTVKNKNINTSQPLKQKTTRLALAFYIHF